MKYIYLIFLTVCLSACCNRKPKPTITIQMCDINDVWYFYAWRCATDRGRDLIFNKEQCEKSKVLSDTFVGQCLYYQIDSAEVVLAKAILRKFINDNETLPSLNNFFRQYIGVKANGKTYIYINLFTHVMVRGEYWPWIEGELYTKDEGKNDYGFIVIDKELEAVTKYHFTYKKD